MTIDSLDEIREGRRGLALALYMNIEDEDWEEYSASISSVLALDETTSRKVLELVEVALREGLAVEVSDDASDAVSIVLASSLDDQVIVARMLESVGGRKHDSDLAATG